MLNRKRSISDREYNRQKRDEADPNSLRNRLRRVARDEARKAIADFERKEAAKRRRTK
jgi:hypothetical protein